jgi:(1->4)-alpha-D-glucan 1-alpha-D-glucosylmutase
LLNSLSQTVLRLTAPGIPDTYQGTELWDFSLVDPDNRRPVDFQRRRRLMNELDRRAEAGNLTGLCADLITNYQDGRVKLWTTMQALRMRRERGDLFHSGKYIPLYGDGARRDHIVAFARELNDQVAVVAVPRLPGIISGGIERAPLGDLWGDTTLPVPSKAAEFMENVFTGEKIRVGTGRTLLCREVFAHFPAALLVCG